MPDDVHELFDDYAARYARGERPDARAYLQRAGPRADDLGRLLEGFVQRAPAQTAPPETVAQMRAWLEGESPLVALRTDRKLRREQVVDFLLDRFSLEPDKRPKVEGYYHQLENGLLDPDRVDRRVWEALAESFRARVAELLTWRPRPLTAEAGAFYRADALAAPAAMRPARTSLEVEEEAESDEVDRLFTGGTGLA